MSSFYFCSSMRRIQIVSLLYNSYTAFNPSVLAETNILISLE